MIESLLQTPADVFCFQRFPEAWLAKVSEAHIFQPAYAGCDNGCLTIHRKGEPRGHGNTSAYIYGENNSQSTAFIETRFSDFILVNTLGPYSSSTEGVPEDHFVKHITTLLARKERAVVVGDMHFDEEPFAKMDLPMNGFKNYSKSKNFNDGSGRGLNLTKLLANFPVQIVKELIVAPDSTPHRHNPVLFELG